MNKKIILALFFSAEVLMPAMAQVSYRSDLPVSWLERGKQMYSVGNYVGCTDQLTRYKSLSDDPRLIEEADFLIAASAYYMRSPQALSLLQHYIQRYPASGNLIEAQFMEGNVYFFSGKYASAVKKYQKIDIDRLTPDNQEEYLYRTGLSYIKTDRIEEAKPCFSALVSVGKKYKEAAVFYNAYIAYTEKEYDKALQGLYKVKDHAEYGIPASYYITQINYAEGRYETVIQDGEFLLARHPGNEFNTELNRLVGESWFRMGEDAKAVGYLEKYVAVTAKPLRNSLYSLGVALYRTGDYSGAVKELSRTTNKNDALSQNAYLYLGQSYLKLGDKNNARLAFDVASRATFDKQVQEAALYNYAMTIHETSYSPFDESVLVFEKFLNTFPRSRYADRINDYLVEVYLNTRNYNAALTSINKIKDPTAKILKAKQRILFQLGTQYFTNNEIDKAQREFTAAIALGNYDKEIKAQACFWRGECKYRNGDYAQAAADYRAYLSSTRETGKPIYGLAQYDLGYALFKLRDFSQALEWFRKYVASSPSGQAATLADAYNRMGDCLYYNRQYAQAESNYAQAQSLMPAAGDYALFQKSFMAGLQKNYQAKIAGMNRLVTDYPQSQYVDDALFEAGLTYLQVGQREPAIQSFTKIIGDFPQSPVARKAGLQLGMVWFNAGESDKSIAAYKQVIEKYPGSDEAKVAVDDLKSVYLEMNDVSTYADYLKSLGGSVRYEVSEMDSLSFLSAERVFLKNPAQTSADGLVKYLQSFPEGAFTTAAHHYLGMWYYNNGEYEQALPQLTAVLQQNDSPYEEDALIRLSDIQYKNHKYDEAISTFKKLEIKASSAENRLAARLGILRSAYELENNEEVIIAADNLLSDTKLSPQLSTEARFYRAMSALKLGQKDKAVADFKILSADARTVYGAEASYRLAQQYFDEGNVSAAEKEINRLIDAGTPHQYWMARGFILLADIYIGKNDNFQARQYLLSLKNNYKGEDDIDSMIEVRLQKLGEN